MEEDVASQTGEGDNIERAETFLGGLRSELDEGSHLHPSFASLGAAADAVRANYLSFSISPQKAAEAFQLLRIIDDNDIEWTIGPSSGTWYRRRVGSSSWQAGPPPLMAEPRSGQGQPWLAAELGELLPAARSTVATGEESRKGLQQAGIRVVDAASIAPEADQEATDFLLAEWDNLEAQFNHLQSSARASVSIEDTAAWPVKQMFEKVVNTQPVQPVAEDTSSLGLPEVSASSGAAPDIFDLFVRPDAPIQREGSVPAEDLLERAPEPRDDFQTEHGEVPVPLTLTEESAKEITGQVSNQDSEPPVEASPKDDVSDHAAPMVFPTDVSGDNPGSAEDSSPATQASNDPYGLDR
jgi:hypothetical protein